MPGNTETCASDAAYLNRQGWTYRPKYQFNRVPFLIWDEGARLEETMTVLAITGGSRGIGRAVVLGAAAGSATKF